MTTNSEIPEHTTEDDYRNYSYFIYKMYHPASKLTIYKRILFHYFLMPFGMKRSE